MAGGSLLTTPSRRGWLSRDPALAAALLFEENNGHLLFMPSIRPFVLLRHVRKPHPVAVAPTSIGGRGIESNRIGQTSGTNTVDLIVV